MGMEDYTSPNIPRTSWNKKRENILTSLLSISKRMKAANANAKDLNDVTYKRKWFL